MGLKDFLPPSPWENAFSPMGTLSRNITMRRNAAIAHELESVITRLNELQGDMIGYINLIEPYAEKRELDTMKKIIGDYPSFKDVSDAYKATQSIKARGLYAKK